MDKLRVAVIGCGRIAGTYCEALQGLQSVSRPVLAMDKHLERAQALAGKFDGCVASDEVELDRFVRLLKEQQVDLVHILLPHHLHEPYTVAALYAGVHVLTEKPIGINRVQAEKMIAAQQDSGMQLGVIFQNRYIDGVRRVRELIQQGEMGQVRGAFSTLNWFRPPSYYNCDWKGRWDTEGGGVVIDQAIHSIDLVRYMTGMDAVRVQGHTARRVLRNIEVEDEADAAITLENGAIYSFFACNYYTSNSPIQVEISCEKATAHLSFDEMEIRWKDGRCETIVPGIKEKLTSGEDYWGVFHARQLADCYAALREGRPMPWSAQDAKKTLEIVEGIYISSKTNREVVLSEV